MESLIKKRKRIKTKITRAENLTTQLSERNITIGILEVRIEQLKENWREFCRVQDEIEESCANDIDLEEQQKVMEDMEIRYCLILDKLNQLIKDRVQMNHTQENGEVSRGNNNCPRVKLPKIELPSFDGNLLEWNSFNDLFSALVDKNPNLSKVEKLQYLKSTLKGETDVLLKSVLITDANYDEAWRMLKDRYDNTKMIVYAHIKELLSFPAMKAESPQGLKGLLDHTVQQVRALKVLKQPVQE